MAVGTIEHRPTPKQDLDPVKAESEILDSIEDQSETEVEVDEPSKRAKKVGTKEKEIRERDADKSVIIGELRAAIQSSGEISSDDLIPEMCVAYRQKHPENELPDETITELIKVIQLFEKILQNQPDLKGAPCEIALLHAFCEPVLNGHLTAAEIADFVKGMRPLTKEEEKAFIEAAREKSGYDGCFFYDPESKMIILTPEAVSGSVGGEQLNLKHIINHEISHGIVDREVFSGYRRGQLDREINLENPQFSNTFTKTAREIIDLAMQSDEFGLSQSQHIRTVLKSLRQAGDQFDDLSTEQKQKHGNNKENYIRKRRMEAAIEIITDYTAIYLQSDGTLEGFISKCIDISRGPSQVEFGRYLQAALKLQNGEDPLQKIGEINDQIQNGEISVAQAVEQHPGLKQLFNYYKVFYDGVGTVMENRGQTEPGDDWDDMLDGYYDSYSGFGQTPTGEKGGKQDSSGWAEVKGLFAAFAAEVNVVEPITK